MLIRSLSLAIGLLLVVGVAGAEEPAKGPHIAHMVYFKLKDGSPEAKRKLVAACDKYLKNHEGVVVYTTGVSGEQFNRPVNDQDWDVALHLIFDSQASHDKYQDHPEHIKFIEENKDGWAKVRVFDALVPAPAINPAKK